MLVDHPTDVSSIVNLWNNYSDMGMFSYVLILFCCTLYLQPTKELSIYNIDCIGVGAVHIVKMKQSIRQHIIRYI